MTDGRKKRILLSPPHMSGTEMKYIQEAIESNWVAPAGPNIEAFERETARLTESAGAAAVSSGTAAIHLSLILLDVQKGDQVFCSSLTFTASANPILYQQAVPVFIDSEPDTWNMCPLALQEALSAAAKSGKLPKAVIVVHLYGQPAKMDEITSICRQYDVPVIEDAAEALGSVYKNRPSGSLGEFGIFSFNGNKIITTSGGGMIVSNDTAALDKARWLASQARDPFPYYQHSTLGYNYRMSNILAGIGLSQLSFLDERVKARRRINRIYKEQLKDLPGLTFMPEMSETVSNRWLTALTIDEETAGIKAASLLSALNNADIEARQVWKPLHLQPLYKYCLFFQAVSGLSIAERLFTSGICLPSGSNLASDEQNQVIETVQNHWHVLRNTGA